MPHITLFKAVFSVKAKAKADVSRKHWLHNWYRCIHRCKRLLMPKIDALPLKVNHTTVYAHVVTNCIGPKIRKSANIDNPAMTIDLMVISHYTC